MPGEIPPKLALAVSAEYAGNYFQAARYYELVWRTDRAWVSAAFGLARVYLAQGARSGAIEVLEAVPDTSSHHVAAQVAAIKIKTRADEASRVTEQDLHDAVPQTGAALAGRRTPDHPVVRGAGGRTRVGPRGPPGRYRRLGRTARCWAAGSPNATCASGWNAATARWPASPAPRNNATTWWTRPTRSARARSLSAPNDSEGHLATLDVPNGTHATPVARRLTSTLVEVRTIKGMRAAAFTEPGPPDVLRILDVPTPEAGPGEVRVRVKAAGVQPYDAAVRAGWEPPYCRRRLATYPRQRGGGDFGCDTPS